MTKTAGGVDMTRTALRSRMGAANSPPTCRIRQQEYDGPMSLEVGALSAKRESNSGPAVSI